MQPREVLQALVNSMEKTLRKEKGGNPASQIPSSSVKQRGEALGKAEAGSNPGRGGRDQREKKPDSNCVACCRDKRRGVPPKTRWKEEQKEKARIMGSSGKENRAVAVPGTKGIFTAMEPEGSEAQQAPEEAQEGVAVALGPEETTAERKSEGGDTQQAPGGAQGGARGPKKEDAPAPVACVTGVPREPANGEEVAQITRPGGRTPPETLEQVNQQYLKSKYKFNEGAPLKEYLQQRISSFREPCTLVEVLTWLKEIIRDNLLFDERNPAMIVGDASLETALRKKKVHVNDIRSVVIQQLTMVEARQGPWNPAMLIGGMTRLGRAPAGPRPEARAVTAPTSAQGARVISLTEVPARSVVLHSPLPGTPRDFGTEVPARSVVMHDPLPGIQQEIGIVSYTAPARPATGQNARGTAATAVSTGAGFTGVRIRPLIRMPGAARGPPPQQGGGGEHQSGHCDADTAAGQCRSDRRIHGIQLREHEKPHGGIRVSPSSGMLDEATGAREPEAQGRKNRVDARRSSIPCRSLQNDGNSDASGLWFKGRVETLEDDYDREAGPDQSPRLLEHIGHRRGNLVQAHGDSNRERHIHGDPRGAGQL